MRLSHLYSLPTYIDTEDNTRYNIRNRGDFRIVLDCFSALNDIELEQTYRVLVALFIFYEKFDTFEDVCSETSERLEELIEKMYNFFNCGMPSDDRTQQYKLIDWEQDEHIIMSAVNNVAGKEVRLDSYTHWWTFMGYYNAIGESSLSFIVSIRQKIVEQKKLDKHEREFRNNNPQYFRWNSKTVEQQELDNLVMEMWNKT